MGVSSGGRPLRLALVTSSYAYIEDGVALTLNRLVRYLESQGVEVLVFTPLSPDRILPHAGTIEAVPSAPMPVRGEYRLTFGLPRAQRERLRAFAPDIVHIATPDFLGHAALKFARELGVPTVASFHTRYDAYLKHYGLGFLHAETGRRLRRFYDAFDEVYAPSASMVEALEADGGRNIRLWSRGVDVDRFHPDKRDETWRAANSIPPEAPVVVFAGRLVREKGLAIFAGAIAALAREGLPHRALVIGDGPDGAGLRAALPDGIFAGFLRGEDLPRALASGDIFLFPSRTETFGSVTLEAMASGLPTICAAATGSRSLVRDGLTGFLVAGETSEAFAAPLRRLVVETATRRRMGFAARERAREFSWEAAMAGLLGHYRALTGSLAGNAERAVA